MPLLRALRLLANQSSNSKLAAAAEDMKITSMKEINFGIISKQVNLKENVAATKRKGGGRESRKNRERGDTWWEADAKARGLYL